MAVQIVLEAMLMVCFCIMRWTYGCLQQCLWFLNGTRKRVKNIQDSEQYTQSAQLMKVWLKFNFDPLLTINSINNFILAHERFVDPEYVLKDEVSLYCITQNQAVFVEAPPGVQVWKMEYGAFHKLAQHNYAHRMIIMPRSSFNRLSQRVGKPKEKLIFLDHVPRSGSTLLCSIFEKSGQCVSFNEPNAFLCLSAFQDFKDPDGARTFLESQVNLLCKPSSTLPKAYVIKSPGYCWSKALMDSIISSYPGAQFIFQYPNGYGCVKSIFKLRDNFKHTQLTNTFIKPFPYLKRKLILKRGLSFGPKTPEQVVPVLQNSHDMELLIAVTRWASISMAYVNLQKDFSSDVFVASKYEDLTANPRGSVEAIFRHCGLDKHSVTPALHAFSTDFQAGTYFSGSVKIGSRHKAFDGLWQKDDVKRDVDFICNSYGITSPDAELRLPYTISQV